MFNIQKWFTYNYENNRNFKLNYNNLLQSSCLTSKNLEDFNNPNYNLSELDIYKYITVLNHLIHNKDIHLALALNPYLINNYKSNNHNNLSILVYNEYLEANHYKNLIIDLYFLDIPSLIHSSIPLDVLWKQIKDKTSLTYYSDELKEINQMGYGFEYFGKENLSLLFPLYLKAFNNKITLYSYQDTYFTLSEILQRYSQDQFNNSNTNLKNYSTLISNWDDLDLKLIKNILTKIKKDTHSITQLNHQCVWITSPSQLSDHFLIDYSLHFDILNTIPNSSDLVFDTYSEVEFGDLIKSNLNSPFMNYIINQNW